MSIILKNKKDFQVNYLKTDSQFINASLLKKIFSKDSVNHLNQIHLYHIGSDRLYGQNQVIRQGQTIQYIIKNPNETLNEVRKKGIIYPEELQKIIENSKIIIIKSANQQNIQKSKDLSLWATTFSNQQRLRYFFNNNPNVILLFATNRSFQIKGLARMQSEPDKIIDKSIWAGVTNIRLGGNFKIKWLRIKPLSLQNVQKVLGSNFKQLIIKSCDGQQIDPQICKKIAYLFDTPQEAIYSYQEKPLQIKQNPIEIEKRQNIYEMIKFPITLPPPIIQPLTNLIDPQQQKNNIGQQDQSSQMNNKSKQKKKKIKKQKKSKKQKKQRKNKNKQKSKKSKKSEKKKRKKYSVQSQEFISSQNNSSSSSCSSEEIKRRKKKFKK